MLFGKIKAKKDVFIMTIKELLFMWLDNYEKERVKPRTYSRYQSIIELHLVPEFGDISIENLKRRAIQEFLTKKKKEGNLLSGKDLSSASTNLMLTVLSMAFEYAIDMEVCEDNPCVRLKRIPEDSKKIDAFTRDEQKKIEAYIKSSDDRRLFGILLVCDTGFRICDKIALEWQDVDFDKGLIYINKTAYRDKSKTGEWEVCIDKPKTKSSERVIPLPTCIIELMKEYSITSKSNYVIENKKSERMSIRSYQYIFEKITEKVGVRKLNFHAIRHTFATRAIECGMDIKTLSEIMGHKNASITLNRYAHSMLDTKIAMMNKMQFIF